MFDCLRQLPLDCLVYNVCTGSFCFSFFVAQLHFILCQSVQKACVDEKVIEEIRISKRRYRFQFYINHLHIWPRNLDGIVVSIFVYILVQSTNVFVFVNSTNISTNIETAMLSIVMLKCLRIGTDLN